MSDRDDTRDELEQLAHALRLLARVVPEGYGPRQAAIAEGIRGSLASAVRGIGQFIAERRAMKRDQENRE